MIRLADVLAAVPGARVTGPVFTREFEGFAYDSRNVRGGEMFVAVRTERADGHDHILDACRRGAAGVLCEHLPEGSDGPERPEGLIGTALLNAAGPDHPAPHLETPPKTLGATCVLVSDVRRALREWARFILRRQGPLVIGVTGSVGKTCVTRAISGVLRHAGGDPRAVFDNDNFNDLFGLPISLSRLEPAHQIAVLELATDSAGEIRALCDLVSPQWGVVSNVAPAHLEHFGTIQRLAEEYGALARSATERLFLNAGDPVVAAMAPHLDGTGEHAPAVVWFGEGDDLPRSGAQPIDVQVTDVQADATGSSFWLHYRGHRAHVQLALPGRHNVTTALAAAAVALEQGYALDQVVAALATLEPPPGRLCPLPGPQGTRLLDDSFSASVPSTQAALDALALAPRPRVVVLGRVSGMASTAASPDGTSEVLGRQLAEVADYVVAVGDAAAATTAAAVTAGLPAERTAVAHTTADTAAIVRGWLAPLLQSADLHPGTPLRHSATQPEAAAVSVSAVPQATILIKGAEASRLERVVERLLQAPEGASQVLVRQAPGSRQVVPLQLDRAAWMEVDVAAIAHNLRRLREIAAPAGVMAVLKADAYGHGAVRVARTAMQHGAAMLGTAVLSEAAVLRAHGITAPILVLGYTPAWLARDVARLDVAVSLFSFDLAQHLSRASQALQRPPSRVHVKVDTGMHRLGLDPAEVVAFTRRVLGLPGVRIEGLYTHLATSDAADPTFLRTQMQRFERVLEEWQAAGLPRPRYVHAANSAATLRLDELGPVTRQLNLVRIGVALFGLHPSEELRCPPDFRPALALKTQLAQVKELPAGEPVSYGCTWVTARPSRIGVIPIGYADGFRRAPATWGEVLVRGRFAPIVGRVCMDMCMVDVTDIPGARVGDEVVLIGEQQGARITAEDVAARLGTINYEVVSQILARVPREIVAG